jgi:hypothetical protein
VDLNGDSLGLREEVVNVSVELAWKSLEVTIGVKELKGFSSIVMDPDADYVGT